MPVYKQNTKVGEIVDALTDVDKRYRDKLVFQHYYPAGFVLYSQSPTAMENYYLDDTNLQLNGKLSQVKNGITINFAQYVFFRTWPSRTGNIYALGTAQGGSYLDLINIPVASLAGGMDATFSHKTLWTDANLGSYDLNTDGQIGKLDRVNFKQTSDTQLRISSPRAVGNTTTGGSTVYQSTDSSGDIYISLIIQSITAY